MQKIFFKILSATLFIVLLMPALGSITSLSSPINNLSKNYQAIVLGKITKQKVKKSGKTYITEYKLKVKKWLYKQSKVKQTKYLTIKVLGAELPEKGIVIKASTTPNFIPINKDAIFLLERNKLKQNDVFTLSKNGVIYKNNFYLPDKNEIKEF